MTAAPATTTPPRAFLALRSSGDFIATPATIG